jgi:chromosome segregation ATPase
VYAIPRPFVDQFEYSEPSMHNRKRENTDCADPIVVQLQQAANLANENCDRATVLAQNLSARLREAESRINQLELELDAGEFANRMRTETEAVVAQIQSDSRARVERAKREAEARIARVEAQAESRICQFQVEFAQAQQRIERAEADAQIAQQRIMFAETEANDLRSAQAELEDQVIRLTSDLEKANLRAGRAEQWLLQVRRQIEDHLMPAFATIHARYTPIRPFRAQSDH